MDVREMRAEILKRASPGIRPLVRKDLDTLIEAVRAEERAPVYEWRLIGDDGIPIDLTSPSKTLRLERAERGKPWEQVWP